MPVHFLCRFSLRHTMIATTSSIAHCLGGLPPHMERPMTPPPRQMYNPYTGAPVASPNRYSNQATYAAQSREAPYEGMNTRQSYLPLHLSTEGQPYNTQPPHHSTQAPPYNTQNGHLAGHDVYNTQQFRSSGHDLAQTPSHSRMTPHDHAERQVQRGLGPAMGHDSCGTTRSMAIGGDYRGTPMGHDSCGTSRSLSTGGDYRGVAAELPQIGRPKLLPRRTLQESDVRHPCQLQAPIQEMDQALCTPNMANLQWSIWAHQLRAVIPNC